MSQSSKNLGADNVVLDSDNESVESLGGSMCELSIGGKRSSPLFPIPGPSGVGKAGRPSSVTSKSPLKRSKTAKSKVPEKRQKLSTEPEEPEELVHQLDFGTPDSLDNRMEQVGRFGSTGENFVMKIKIHSPI